MMSEDTFKANISNLKATLIRMGLTEHNAESICKSLTEQHASSKMEDVLYRDDIFVDATLLWNSTKEGYEYWERLRTNLFLFRKYKAKYVLNIS